MSWTTTTTFSKKFRFKFQDYGLLLEESLYYGCLVIKSPVKGYLATLDREEIGELIKSLNEFLEGPKKDG